MVTRRQLVKSSAALAFIGLAQSTLGKTPGKSTLSKTQALDAKGPPLRSVQGYGSLIADPNKLLDLPAGFQYDVISQLGDKMDDGLTVPNRADGMGCFALDEHRVALVRNHELDPSHFSKISKDWQTFTSEHAFDSFQHRSQSDSESHQRVALPGGTTTIVYNTKDQKREKEFVSLTGTIRNCSGGVTPWGSWLTCEESVETSKTTKGKIGKSHGYVFEVPADASGPVKPVPLKAMGRFNHEAVVVDPRTGIAYLTEDRNDSLLYRFIPKENGKLSLGGQLQALVIKNTPQFDTRNWSVVKMAVSQWYETEWVDLSNPESPEDDLRLRGYQKGAAVFARGEGIHWADDELYFCCTSGGKKKLGQIMRYRPSKYEGSNNEAKGPGQLQLFLESTDPSLYNFGDNLTVTPQNHLLVCEDQYTDVVDNYLRGVTPSGEVYAFARLHEQTELAGACFSPDGSTLFVNVYSPAKTLAIRGPWEKFMV
ncbi:alkaline phosphatase PhoX [Marinibactrum halimedae]|uniref:dTDP-glucose 4,6-dehydratase n=1 Tax=Marinibactrum halimedae TaxID=1444977 RepID=A0AA37T2U2_9GAMM|nr:alkaline phosphatase PhoX [Marinibactrum halimedae]MCD9459624.1 DUF839 domain-containing protein [Marinibactrum halimedae]GLS25650.1 dTDP-glucose 4,6-dehydratase [Marinibactrum halimedae]